MLPAKPVTDIADSIQALLVRDILPVLDKISSAKYQVIMYMPFVNVCRQHIFILPAEDFFCQLLSNPVRVLIGHFPRLEGLNQMVRQIVAFLVALIQSKFHFYICGLHRAAVG